MGELTASQVKRAGQVLRRWQRGEKVPAEAISRAYDTLVAYRAEHSMPLRKANMGLRSMVRTVISEAMAVEEAGGVVDSSLLTEMRNLWQQAAPYLNVGRREA